MERAKRRLEYFENFKAETLLKFMKGIVKNPRIIRQNTKSEMKYQYGFLQRCRFLKERNTKITLFKLFLRQYEL